MAALCLAAAPAFAQTQAARESAVKAAFLFKFGAFVEWPAGTFARTETPLVIGVAGDDAVAEDLESLSAGRTVEGRPVVVKRITDLSKVIEVNVLFVGSQRDSRLKEILLAVKGPVLVVTDQDTGLQQGGVINFSAATGRVRFSVSLASAEARQLRLSARLLAVAQSVEGPNR